jgi:hypothetical protein
MTPEVTVTFTVEELNLVYEALIDSALHNRIPQKGKQRKHFDACMELLERLKKEVRV